ncbi:hypothetical protein GW17_00053421 [Ensete ventricosum]|nr:hypothetical protein GW17_00053421 [Ensete ventricosum]
MAWTKSYLDAVLVPIGLLFPLIYHLWLWHKVRSQPLSTTIGINSAGRRLWVLAIIKVTAPSPLPVPSLLSLKLCPTNLSATTSCHFNWLDNEKKNILAVQTIRNTIMGSTLMATTSILLCSGLAAVISSTYSVKKPLNDSVLGAQGEFIVSLKYVTLLLLFLFAFLCYSLSIRFVSQANFLINTTPCNPDAACPVTPDYVCNLLERSFALNTVGNRLFYAALPVLLWILGPVLVLVSSLAMVLILYKFDMVCEGRKHRFGAKVEEDEEERDCA